MKHILFFKLHDININCIIKVNIILQFKAKLMRCFYILLAMFTYLFNSHYNIQVKIIIPCLIKQMMQLLY